MPRNQGTSTVLVSNSKIRELQDPDTRDTTVSLKSLLMPARSSKKEGKVATACEFIQAPKNVLKTLRSLTPDKVIVLLTPFMAPFEGTDRMQAFEAFGRGISAHHSRVAHLPYMTESGLTATHREYIRSAGAVMLVTKDAQATEKQLIDIYTTTEQLEAPVILVQFGGPAIVPSYSKWIYLDASHASLETYTLVTRLLFGSLV